MKTSFLSTIPFSGFCNSIHSDEIDHTLEQMLSDHDTGCEFAPSFICDAAWQAVNYGDVYREYAASYAESFLDWLGLDGKFESMTSPREYNFETDRVFVELTRADLARIWSMVPKAELTKAAKSRFTSRDGFISSYSPDWRTWGKLSAWDHNQIGTLLGCAAEYEQGGGFDQWAEFELIEGARCNGEIAAWICDNAEPNLTRALNAWDYLQDRARRTIKTMAQWHEARRAENRPFITLPLWQCADGVCIPDHYDSSK